MTSTIKVNNVQNQCGQNIINESSNTITIGASGDTIALASGASQTGFGRTGTVDWQTSIKTAASFTPANGEGYFVDTSSNAVTANLPAGSVGAIVAFKDYAQNFDTNALTIVANGSEKIEGQTFNLILNIEGQGATLVYGDATKGWQVVNSNDIANVQKFVTATGGTETVVCTNFKVHTFTGPGTFDVQCAGNPGGSSSVDYLVVAGGGGGGSLGGGGGGGGFRESPGTASGSYTASPLGTSPAVALPVTARTFPITVGAGGAGGGPTQPGAAGSVSTFSTITSAGGGFGGGHAGGAIGAGGSGGGQGFPSGPTSAGAAGNTPPVDPPQGQPGGGGQNANTYSGGGGGATEAGETTPGSAGGRGGAGGTTNIPGSPISKSGGGGGGINGAAPGSAGAGSPCGSGAAGIKGGSSGAGPSASANTGGGGGGGAHTSSPPTGSTNGGAGGSGIVVIRYKFQ
tara:strand:- start:1418 stop:2791 length:1374 start_codon:yes stop_codon:yes gene_type:complete